MTISVVLIRKRMRRFFYRTSPQTLSRPSAQHHLDYRIGHQWRFSSLCTVIPV